MRSIFFKKITILKAKDGGRTFDEATLGMCAGKTLSMADDATMEATQPQQVYLDPAVC